MRNHSGCRISSVPDAVRYYRTVRSYNNLTYRAVKILLCISGHARVGGHLLTHPHPLTHVIEGNHHENLDVASIL
jgi:hypothetical protein